jgi:hypothetical protein
MRSYEFISENRDYVGVAKQVAPKSADVLLTDYPWAQKLINASPNIYDALRSIIQGNVSMAAINAVKAVIPLAKMTPIELKQVADYLSKASTTGSVATQMGAGASTMAANATPIAMLAAPYVLAGAERDKINADPWNTQYDNNPYAQSVRSGGTVTQGQAGAANRRNAVKNFSTSGNPAQQ